MKKILLLFCTAIIASQFTTAQVAINTDGTTPSSSAMLDIKSTSKGLLTPRMTTAQRTSIASPATGLMVYDTDVNKFFFYALGSWIEMGTGSATNYWTLNGNDISKNNSGNVGIGVVSPSGTLDVARGTAPSGTAMFRGTTYASHFNFGTNEDTYIRGGKDLSNVIINDNNLGKVGIGTSTPGAPLHVVGLSNELLRLQSLNPYLSLYSINSPIGYLQAFNNDLLLGTFSGNATGAIRFYNNNIANMTLDYDGTVGIGTTSPLAKLHVAQDNEALRISGNQSYISFYNGNTWKGYLQSQGDNNIVLSTYGNNNGELYLAKNGTPALTVQSDGRVKVGDLGCNLAVPLIGTGLTSQYPKFSVHGPLGLKKSWGDQIGEWTLFYGAVQSSSVPVEFNQDVLSFSFNGGIKAWIDDEDGEYHSVSDVRLKENFENYKSVLPGIKKLNVFTYHYRADKSGRRSFGLVAQNLKQYFPELVSGSEESGSYLGISYAKTGVLAIKAIQEQQVIIETLEKKIELLEKRLAALESKLR